MMLFSRNNNKLAPGIEEKIKKYRRMGCTVPTRKMIKNEEQIAGIRESSKINTGVLDHVAQHIKAGMSTEDVNTLVHEYTLAHGAIPAPLNYEGFPKSVCVSINEEVCHGIPSKDVILRDGDIVNVDVSTIYNGYFSDASRMFLIGDVSPERRRLVDVTRECLELGIEAARPWGFLGDIGEAIQEYAESNGYSVVREFSGHAAGIASHARPAAEHAGRRRTGMLLVPGMIFTIEPMINMGKPGIFIDEENGWTVITEDEKPSAQWENTILITEAGVERLTW